MSKPTKYWFKRRRYGWGWTPATYDGWLVFGIYIVLVVVAIMSLGTTNESYKQAPGFLAIILFLTLCLVVIAIAKGPQPKWRWGKKDHDNHDEDI